MKKISYRYLFAIILFIIGAIIAVMSIPGLKNPSNIGPGSGMSLFLPIPAAIIGYFLGSILDLLIRLFKRNK